MIGRATYSIRRGLRFGVSAGWQRIVLRPKILSSPPVNINPDLDCEIHALTCESDWLDLIWGLKTLYHFSECNFPLCIHDDGSLPFRAVQAFKTHFPFARFLTRSDSDTLAEKALRDFPRSRALRHSNALSLKIFDFMLSLETQKMLVLDCDVLFLRRPDTLLSRALSPSYRLNSLNRDWRYGYSLSESQCSSSFSFFVPPLINSGLGVIHKSSYTLELFEEWLGVSGVLSHPHRIEQTLAAVASARFGHEFLPDEYNVTVSPFESTVPVRHFTGPIRHLLYSRGLPHVAKELL